MTTITLHAYHQQINKLLDDNQYGLAIEHCRHILQQQPQHIATYRLLAKALLEKGEYTGATELFQRILSAAPSDYIAHAGLSIIYKEEDVLPQAIWHLERAYEIEPYNATIQQELRALYTNHHLDARRSGPRNGDTAVIPATLFLTEGALSRLYLRSELYDQAVTLLRAAIAKDEERVDLRVLLMEALWRNGRRMEAVNAALNILDHLPNCITANAILAEIWLRTGRVDEAQAYLQRVHGLLLLDTQHLDPETPEGSAFCAEGAFPLPPVIELDYLGMEGGQADFEETGVWSPVTPALAGQPETETETDDDMYQWLEGLTGELPPVAAATSAMLARTDEDEDTAEGDALIPEVTAVTKPQSDWLTSLVGPDEDETSESDLFAADQNEAALDWLAGEDAGLFVAPAAGHDTDEDDLAPDWLSAINQDDLEPIQLDTLTAAAWMRESEPAAEADDGAAQDEYEWLEIDPDDAPDDAAAGEIDLSQFGDFQRRSDSSRDDEEVVWRLTDELKQRDVESDAEAEAAAASEDIFAGMDLSLPADLHADVPTWLMGGSETGDLYDDTAATSGEVAQELAAWVAASNPADPETDDAMDWFRDDALEEDDEDEYEDEDEFEDEEFFADEPEVATTSAAYDTAVDRELDLPDSGSLPEWLSHAAPSRVDSDLLGTGSLAQADDQPSDDLISDELPDWLQSEAAAIPAKPVPTGSLPDWLVGASLDTMDSAPLDETKAAQFTDQQSEVDSPPADAWEEQGLGTPVMSGMLSAAARMDDLPPVVQDDDLDLGDTLPDWLMSDDDAAPFAAISSLDVDLEEVVSDDKEETTTGPTKEPETPTDQPAQPDEELDWLDDLASLSQAAVGGAEALQDSGELPEWMGMDLDELAEETAVSLDEPEPAITLLDEEPELDWLDALAASETTAEPQDELPTWQWPEAQPGPDQPADKLAAAAETDWDAALLEIGQEPAAVPGELDDAMAWLEELAGEPGAPVEELPTVAQDPDLDDLFTSLDVSETILALDSPEEAFDLPPEDPDEAMAWLERLAARQGAPLDELPSVPTDSQPVEGIADWMFAADAVETAADEGFEQGLFDSMPTGDADWTADGAELEGIELEELDIEPVEVLLTAAAITEEPEDAIEDDLSLAVPDDPDELMAWLERLAARQGAPLDELPSIDAETWLDEPLTKTPSLEALEPELEALESEDEFWPAAMGLETAVSDASQPDLLPEALEDLDETMAWLEGLTAGQGAASADLDLFGDEIGDELGDEIGDKIAVEIAGDLSLATPPAPLDDLADTMSWLENLAEEEGEDETAVPDWLPNDEDVAPETRHVPPVAPALLAELAWLEEETDWSSAAAPTPDSDLDALIISDEELAAALDQLESLVGLSPVEEEPPAPQPKDLPADIADEADDLLVGEWSDDEWSDDLWDDALLNDALDEDGDLLEPTVAKIESSESAAGDDLLEAIPDDPDEAMAWLERLAARQGASLDELPSLYDADEATLAALTAVPPLDDAPAPAIAPKRTSPTTLTMRWPGWSSWPPARAHLWTSCPVCKTRWMTFRPRPGLLPSKTPPPK
ncbi:MAG: tetratricopeptide repeat protein [Chloroflexi bacterium]|nr:tetratricopeptide repeat protein [Chloroflexota bacterium]